MSSPRSEVMDLFEEHYHVKSVVKTASGLYINLHDERSHTSHFYKLLRKLGWAVETIHWSDRVFRVAPLAEVRASEDAVGESALEDVRQWLRDTTKGGDL